MAELVVLMVAEKPSIAETLASALSGGTAVKRSSILQGVRAPVFEYMGSFAGESACFRVTATAGHIYSLDFDQEHNDQQKTDPAELFSAPVISCYDARARLPEHLSAEGAGCHALVLWLDCDREGENICFEVMRNVMPAMDDSRWFEGAFRDRIFRAKFSSLVGEDLRQAMDSLGQPNVNESHSVDARQEIDLRLGVAFSRLMTKYFRQHFVSYLGQTVRSVTYGPCQMPTLWFCVHRHCQIKKFTPVPYWCVTARLRIPAGVEFLAHEVNGRMWDEADAHRLLQRTLAATKGVISLVKRNRARWERPLPLNTVALLQKASERLGMSPGDTMHYAEQLYLKGILSYPRTETNRYPAAFDFAALAQTLQSSALPWSDKAALVVEYLTPPRADGIDHGDHPPITPVRSATESECRDEIAWGLYKLVCEHFLATMAPDCFTNEAVAYCELGGLQFVARSSRSDLNMFSWCNVVGELIEDKGEIDVGELCSDMLCSVENVNLDKDVTHPPPFVNESELIALMEEHGIGTDASMAQHINNILKRGYVWLDHDSRQLVPTAMGLALIYSFTEIDRSLAYPTVRSAIENECTKVAKGKARKGDVVHLVMNIFEQKFKYFRKRLSHVPMMLAMALAEENGHDHDAAIEIRKEWNHAIDSTAAVSLVDLLNSRSSSALEVGFEAKQDELTADSEDLAAVRLVQDKLEEMGFAPSLEDQEHKRKVQQAAEGTRQHKRIKVFIPDPNKNGLANFHELCSRISVKNKEITALPEESKEFRGTIKVVLSGGEACEYVSSQLWRKKKDAEHDVASIATADLVSKLEACGELSNFA